MDRTQFLANRRTGVGGSDAAAIMGMSPWSSQHTVYLDKLGLSEEMPQNQRLEAGIRLEPVLRDWYGDEVQRPVMGGIPMLRHPEHEFMICHLDGVVGLLDDPEGILEIKTADGSNAYLWGELGTDDVPMVYNLQCQHNMIVASGHYRKTIPWCDVPVLIAGNDFRIYRVEANEKIQEMLIKEEDKFWQDHVLKSIPPAVDGSKGASDMLKGLFPRSVETEMAPTDGTIADIEEYLRLREQIADLSDEKTLFENKIKEYMGDAAILTGKGYRFSWRTGKDKSKVDWEAVAKSYNPGPVILAEHTTTAPGSRRFLPPRRKVQK